MAQLVYAAEKSIREQSWLTPQKSVAAIVVQLGCILCVREGAWTEDSHGCFQAEESSAGRRRVLGAWRMGVELSRCIFILEGRQGWAEMELRILMVKGL